MKNRDKVVGGIKLMEKNNGYYTITFETGEEARLHILNDHVFRYYMSPSGVFLEYPEPMEPDHVAKMIDKTEEDYGFASFKNSILTDFNSYYIVQTLDLQIFFDKIRGTMKVHDKRKDKEVLTETMPLSYIDCESTQFLHQRKEEYFFGGGMQNGRFTHKGNVIRIENTNDWNDGGVASPCPFYWSSYGYGVLRNTWQKGIYDFGKKSDDVITTTHDGEDFDAYFFINSLPKDILNDYYELTGRPILMPEYAYYEAHLNAFNRDYWVEVNANTYGAILFEDGKYYKSYQPSEIGDRKGILESLNGERNNYQFSARAMIDRYRKHDMPLGWLIPNDGYGCGYGQTDTLDGDIQNLKKFVDYALENGVEVALWTESNLYPEDPLNPKKGERDLGKEVGIAKVVALKCDVKWIGYGYSFGLTAVANATDIFIKESKHNNVRPMILMVDGWAGTQRYSGIWSGDQKGGEWEYIRFHIPTYIGTGLSGQPVIGSDMDGIYSGGCKEVNIREYQWKTFTPLQLNMDGWGNTQKTPFSFDEEATKINRAYLKLKSMLMPYNYSIGHETIHGFPMIRAMFLEFPDESPAYTKDSQYQYMWGPNILVAPIYNDTKDDQGNSVRNGIYLPDSNQVWIEFFTGLKYQGGKIYNEIVTPLWKIPVFVKDGSIIPMTNPNNNPSEINRDYRTFTIHPNGASSFIVYEDDGISSDYLQGPLGNATTKIDTVGPESDEVGDLLIKIFKTVGDYKNMTKERKTVIEIMASEDVQRIKVDANGKAVMITKVKNMKEFESRDNVFIFMEDFALNPYLQEFKEVKQKVLVLKIEKVDVTATELTIKVIDYTNRGEILGKVKDNPKLSQTVSNFHKSESTLTSITLDWEDDSESTDFYEIDRDGVVFTNITKKSFTFHDLDSKTALELKIRSVTNNTASEWSDAITASPHEDFCESLIFGVHVTCNLPCQPHQEVDNLTDDNPRSLWHTDWGHTGQAKPENQSYITLLCDLGNVYELDKVVYVPREDAGNGTILEIQYTCSENNTDWSPLSDAIEFECNNSSKTIHFEGKKLRYLQLIVLSSVGDFGSGRHLFFYKK